MEDKNLVSFDEILNTFKKLTEFNEYQNRLLEETHNTRFLNISNDVEDTRFSELTTAATINSYRPIVSHRKATGKLIIFAKKVIRKAISWYIDPICRDITHYNNVNAEILIKLRAEQLEISKELGNVRNLLRENITRQQSYNVSVEAFFKEAYENYLEIEFEIESIKKDIHDVTVINELSKKIREQEVNMKLIKQELSLREIEMNYLRKNI